VEVNKGCFKKSRVEYAVTERQQWGDGVNRSRSKNENNEIDNVINYPTDDVIKRFIGSPTTQTCAGLSLVDPI
jgi:hypothetical protein